MIYNLKITAVINRNLQGFFVLVPIKIGESLQFKTILVFKLFTNYSFCLQIITKNIFVYFYSKKSLKIFLEQRVKSNKQRAKTNQPRAKTNEQQRKRNKPRAKTNEQRATRKTFQLIKNRFQRRC